MTQNQYNIGGKNMAKQIQEFTNIQEPESVGSNYLNGTIENLAKLTLQERDYVERKVENESKSSVIVWLLSLFFGGAGAHRLYMGKIGSGVALLLVTLLISWWTFFIPTLIWVIIDAFQINSWLRKDKDNKREDAIKNILLLRN